ncbi:MAG: DUF3313 family protein, partial [Lysobacterales bacterium]
MQTNRFYLTILMLLFSFAAVSPAWAKKDLPEVNDEGMVLVENSDLATVYADPGADLGIYDRIMLLDATVAFKKNWQRDQNRSNPLKVKDRDMVKIQEEVAALFREVFTKELVDGGYEMADEPNADVLLVKPAIVDLDISAPDIPSSNRTRSYSESAGEMTLNLELYDSLTDDKIAKATDRKRDYDNGYQMRWRTSVSNRSDAKRMMTAWAKALRSTLDEARASTSQPDT